MYYDVVFMGSEEIGSLVNIVSELNLTFYILRPPLVSKLKEFLEKNSASVLITDRQIPSSDKKLKFLLNTVVVIQIGESFSEVADITMKSSDARIKLKKTLAKLMLMERRRTNNEIPKNLTEREKLLYSLLKNHPEGLHARTILSLLGWKQTTFRTYVHRLRQKGIRIQKTLDGRYLLNPV